MAASARRPIQKRTLLRIGKVCPYGYLDLVERVVLISQVGRSSRGRAGVLVGLDGCEVRLCDPCARVRPRAPCVSRLPPVSFSVTGTVVSKGGLPFLDQSVRSSRALSLFRKVFCKHSPLSQTS